MDGASRAPADPALAAVKTWRYLRLAMIVLVVALLTSVLYEHAAAPGGCWQESISAYWYTPARGVLVGALIAIGTCLICLKGDTEPQDLLLNLAGSCAPVVALVPTPDPGTCGSVLEGTAGRDAQVANNVPALLVAGGLGLLVVGVLAVVGLVRRTRRRPRPPALAGFGVLAAVYAATLTVFLVDRDRFVASGHLVAAGAMFGFIFLTVCLTAVDFRTSRTGRRGNRYTWVAVLMALAAVVHVVLIVALHWEHWALSLETTLILLFALFWLLQTVELWNEGLRRRPGPRSEPLAPPGPQRDGGPLSRTGRSA